jgi:hypothetical protein
VWVRTGTVASLGHLLVALSPTFTAAEIYYTYSHLPIVAVKRWPRKWANKAAPTGMRVNKGLRGVMGNCKGWQHELVAEYCTLRSIDDRRWLTVPVVDSSDWKECLSEALCHVHMMLLRDMRPPFSGTQPDMLSSASATMSRMWVYARATFLKWDATVALAVFGTDIVQTIIKRTSQYDLDFGGIVARPLYICGALKQAADLGPLSDSPGDAATAASFCQNVASMTPLLKFKDERQHWRCASCAEAGIPADTPPKDAPHVPYGVHASLTLESRFSCCNPTAQQTASGCPLPAPKRLRLAAPR